MLSDNCRSVTKIESCVKTSESCFCRLGVGLYLIRTLETLFVTVNQLNVSNEFFRTGMDLHREELASCYSLHALGREGNDWRIENQ